ncbi:glucokinase [Escherichia coli]|uniref:Glucokinase n=1 Tax=Escherichia coli TaxID=562 RepID=A0A376TUP5_ECOLX|nr:glucokinase [Escherichia coli]
MLSGPGLVNLYRAIVKADNACQKISSQKILPNVRWLIAAPIAAARCRCFCVIMGRFGGNLALNLGTFGGVFIAGGIVPRFLEFFKASGFRCRI